MGMLLNPLVPEFLNFDPMFKIMLKIHFKNKICNLFWNPDNGFCFTDKLVSVPFWGTQGMNGYVYWFLWVDEGSLTIWDSHATFEYKKVYGLLFCIYIHSFDIVLKIFIKILNLNAIYNNWNRNKLKPRIHIALYTIIKYNPVSDTPVSDCYCRQSLF